MKHKTVGYVVNGTAGPYLLREKTLWLGSTGTLFKTRWSAKRALEVTKRFAEQKGYDWPWLNSSRVLRIERAA